MRNFEVLKNYFLGKNPDLIETMADNSLKLIGIEGRHFVLRSELIQRLNELREDLESVDQQLEEGISSLAEALSADIEALQEADRTMQGDIGSLDLRTDTLEYWKNNNNFVMLEDLNTRLGSYYTKAQVDSLIAAIPTLTYEIVQTLPTQDIDTRTIYLVPSQDPEQGNYYEEYMYISNAWELIGTTAVDLSDYYTKSQVDSLIPTKTSDLINDSLQEPITLTKGLNYYLNEMDEGVYVIPFSYGQPTTIYANNTDISTQNVIFSTAEAISASGTKYSGAVMIVEKTIEITGTVPVVPIPSQYTIFSNNTLIWGEATDTTHTKNITELGQLQTTNNLVTTISSSSTNTQYPSAAATYTALSGKQDAITLTAGGSYYIDQMSEGIYIIPYHTLQATRIYDNSSRKNLIFNTIYYDPFGGMLSSSTYYGAVLAVTKTTSGDGMLPGSPTWQYNILSNNMLTYGNVTSSSYNKYTLSLSQIQKTSNLVTTISASSTNTQYPGAKAVYDSLPKTFTGTDGQTAGTGGLVPAPATTDVGKYLKSDGTWAEAGGGTNISYGTTDLTPGVSELAEGEVYLCFE